MFLEQLEEALVTSGLETLSLCTVEAVQGAECSEVLIHARLQLDQAEEEEEEGLQGQSFVAPM